MSKQQEWIQEELERRRQAGEDVGVMAQFSAMKAVMGRLQNEMKKAPKSLLGPLRDGRRF